MRLTPCLQGFASPHHQLRQRADHAVGNQRLAELEVLGSDVACTLIEGQIANSMTSSMEGDQGLEELKVLGSDIACG